MDYHFPDGSLNLEKIKRAKEVDILIILFDDEEEAIAFDPEVTLESWLAKWRNHLDVVNETAGEDVYMLQVRCSGIMALELPMEMWSFTSAEEELIAV